LESIFDILEPIWIGFFLHSVDAANTSNPITLDISCNLCSLMLPASANLPVCYTSTQDSVTCTSENSGNAGQEQTIQKISVSGTVNEINQMVGMIGYVPAGANVGTISFAARDNKGLLPSSAQLDVCSCSAVGTCIPRAGSYSCTCNAGWTAAQDARSCEVSAYT
jgi:hypothetical protein